MKVSETFTSRLLSNHTTKMTQVYVEINNNLHFLNIGMMKRFKSSHNVVDVEKLQP